MYGSWISGHPQAQPIDFSRVNLQDLGVPEVMPLDTFDDHELDQYLPNGLPNTGHMAGNNQSDQYSSCYQGNATSSAANWSGCFRPSTGSCMQAYSSLTNSTNTSNVNNTNTNNNIPSPYDLSGASSPNNQGNSPNAIQSTQQTSSPTGSMHSPGFQGANANTSCKVRDDSETGIKIEPANHPRGPAPRYPCDNKFDYTNAAVSRFEGSAHQNMAYTTGSTHAQYMHSLNYPHMGMSRQMFNPIAAAVPGEQQWERYTWKIS